MQSWGQLSSFKCKKSGYVESDALQGHSDPLEVCLKICQLDKALSGTCHCSSIFNASDHQNFFHHSILLKLVSPFRGYVMEGNGK